MINFIIIGDQPTKGAKVKGWNGASLISERKSIVSSQISSSKILGKDTRILYVYGFDHKKVENYFELNYKQTKLIYNKEHINLGETHSVSRTSNYLDSDSLIINSKCVLKPSTFKNLNRKHSHIFTTKNHNQLGCHIENNKISHICYELDNYITDMFFIAKKDIELFRSMVINKKHRNCFIFEIINKMIDKGCDFRSLEIHTNQQKKIKLKT